MVNPYGKFSEPGSPHNFAKNDRHDLKMECTDASRHAGLRLAVASGLRQMLTATCTAWAVARVSLVCIRRVEWWTRCARHAGLRLAAASGLGQMLTATAWAVWTWALLGLLLVLVESMPMKRRTLFRGVWQLGPGGNREYAAKNRG
jgi:hypothetical protein